MTRAFFHLVYDLLVECAGASGAREDFVDYFTEKRRGPWEYRFMGSLGMGGKLYLATGRLYVSCYPEDRTDARDALIERLNVALAAMLSGHAAETTIHRIRTEIAVLQGRVPADAAERVAVSLRRKDAEAIMRGDPAPLHAMNCIATALAHS